jgi:hypothetical protein
MTCNTAMNNRKFVCSGVEKGGGWGKYVEEDINYFVRF